MILLIMGCALAFNLLVIKWKFEHSRNSDAFLDLGLLALIAMFFSGSKEGLMIGTIASAIISIYLLRYPPKKFDTSIFKLKD